MSFFSVGDPTPMLKGINYTDYNQQQVQGAVGQVQGQTATEQGNLADLLGKALQELNPQLYATGRNPIAPTAPTAKGDLWQPIPNPSGTAPLYKNKQTGVMAVDQGEGKLAYFSPQESGARYLGNQPPQGTPAFDANAMTPETQNAYNSQLSQYQNQLTAYNNQLNQAPAANTPLGSVNTVNSLIQASDPNNPATGIPNNVPSDVDLSQLNRYMDNGNAASDRLAALSGLGPNPMNSQQIYEAYLNNPAVQAQMEQGNAAISNNYSARGLLGSGGLLKALNSYGQGVAAQTLNQAQDNLYRQAQTGASAAGQYQGSVLNKYGTDQTANTAARSIQANREAALRANQTSLIGQQANLYGSMNDAARNYASLLGTQVQTAGQLGSAAINNIGSILGNHVNSAQTEMGVGVQAGNGLFTNIGLR